MRALLIAVAKCKPFIPAVLAQRSADSRQTQRRVAGNLRRLFVADLGSDADSTLRSRAPAPASPGAKPQHARSQQQQGRGLRNKRGRDHVREAKGSYVTSVAARS